MSLESLQQFKRLVLGDGALAALLHAEDDRERFAAVVVRLGAERGFTFTREEVEEAMREARRDWVRRLA